MYKIEVGSRGGKRKYYESRAQFNRFWPMHVKRLGFFCEIIGYELVSVKPNVWNEIKKHIPKEK